MKRITLALAALAATAGLGLAHAGQAQAATPPLTMYSTYVGGGASNIWITMDDPNWSLVGGTQACSGMILGQGTWDYSNGGFGPNGALIYQVTARIGQQVTASCQVQGQVQRLVSVKRTGQATRPGANTASRSVGAYSLGGNCDGTSRDGSGRLISTCVFAHASLGYSLTLPKGKTFTGISHSVSAGIEPCRNASWHITHKRGTRTWHATFTHGSVGGFSQCDVHNVRLHYRWTARVQRWFDVSGTVTGSAVVS